ncbi:unnamed protein product [Rotaria sp. Silwood2]|nr:unnamed protein product [Rotaria sp. Silwood2]CAF3226797.1 unnamed protein product [Rotaria sp. Silwood2]CAF4602666.1 unnamed protein product [Rotaria sp. Silwood2]CAF4669683.1 unnamed protein product [Rotaria sp. Silwood2]
MVLLMLNQNPHIKRGLTLLSKILQSIVNNLIFTTEFHMRCFNDYFRSTFDLVTNFILSISKPININTIISSDEQQQQQQQLIENNNNND